MLIWILTLLGLIAIPIVLYPCLIFARACLFRRPVKSSSVYPTVDLIICAYNEEDSIYDKISNTLELSYPTDKLTVWVASDGSVDKTVEIARSFDDSRIHVLDLPRRGKAETLIDAVAAGNSDVLAFSDANSMWVSDALERLTAPLADPGVGGVAGNQSYSGVNTEGVGERTYWNFDTVLKLLQSKSGSVISATGAIYSIRRKLFEAPPLDATDDFMISTGVIAQRSRLVMSKEAVALEAQSGSREEFARKVRVITRGLNSVYYRRALLNPLRYGFYSLELLCHKFLRRLIFVPFFLLCATAPFLLLGGLFSTAVGISILALVALGLLGTSDVLRRRIKVVALAHYLFMVNIACALAVRNFVVGNKFSRWDNLRAGSVEASR